MSCNYTTSPNPLGCPLSVCSYRWLLQAGWVLYLPSIGQPDHYWRAEVLLRTESGTERRRDVSRETGSETALSTSDSSNKLEWTEYARMHTHLFGGGIGTFVSCVVGRGSQGHSFGWNPASLPGCCGFCCLNDLDTLGRHGFLLVFEHRPPRLAVP